MNDIVHTHIFENEYELLSIHTFFLTSEREEKKNDATIWNVVVKYMYKLT